MSSRSVFVVFASVIALGALLLGVALLKRSPQPPVVAEPAQEQAASADEASAIKSPVIITNVVATTPEQDQEEQRNKSIDELKDALLEGSSNPANVQTVRNYLQSSDGEVRKTAVLTMVHMNDREGIASLKLALDKVQDPREKVAILDAIDYLETPEDPMIQAVEESITNAAATAATSPK